MEWEGKYFVSVQFPMSTTYGLIELLCIENKKQIGTNNMLIMYK